MTDAERGGRGGAGAPPARLERAAAAVVRRLRAHGHEALFAGGCVRDRLLGVPPKDIDIATSATPRAVQALFRKTIPVGEQFGVVRVHVGRLEFEVATFRADGPYLDGRRPASVRFAAAAEDAQRRDFTINGMFYDPASGEVLDLVGGRADLAARVVRAIGDPAARFGEDRLRLLRAVRFACQLGFSLDPATAAAARALAAEVRQVSAERVHAELTRMLTGPRPRRAVELLDELGLLAPLLPEVVALKGVEQPPQFHPEGDVWTHTLLVMENLRPEPSPALALAALLHDIGKPPTFVRAPDRIRFDLHAERGAEMARAICARLRCSGAEADRVVLLIENHLRFLALHDMRESTLKRLLREPWSEELLELFRADALGSLASAEDYEFCRRKLEGYRREEAERSLRPARLISGHDLIALGYRPGPAFAGMLAAVEDAQLEGEVATREAALAWVRERYPAG
ncbi:MAG: CCA tRNA nucleotidyltransferase [Planctomycetes bacterium]|nr:CCA tRNA nucleotidyltransferase [Planctomycetota bacterium]